MADSVWAATTEVLAAEFSDVPDLAQVLRIGVRLRERIGPQILARGEVGRNGGQLLLQAGGQYGQPHHLDEL